VEEREGREHRESDPTEKERTIKNERVEIEGAGRETCCVLQINEE
jgi:hypothetical protein